MMMKTNQEYYTIKYNHLTKRFDEPMPRGMYGTEASDDVLIKYYQAKVQFYEGMKDEAKGIDNDNDLLYRTAKEDLSQYVRRIKEIFGEFSKEYKYVSKLNVPSCPLLVRTVESFIEEAQKALKVISDRQAEQERTLLHSTRQQAAVLFLTNHGMTLGKDYQLVNAITTANDKYFDILVAKAIEDGAGDIEIDFCDYCNSWDGEDNRCSCGNRRVYWTGGHVAFDDPTSYVYPAAD